MRNRNYNEVVEKSIGDEVPAALEAFNRGVTQLLQEVELDQNTEGDLMSVKLRVNRQALGLQGRSE